jgi:cyclophilin family peptidyl-prolyl cis-trans isomerase/HEAT repeat protein
LRRLLTAAMSLMLVAGTVGAQSGARAPSAGEVRLYTRLMSMTDSRSFDKSLLDSVLAARWRPLRSAGALAIGQIGRAHGLPGLVILHPLLSDSDTTVAANAAYAVGLLRDSASVGPLTAALSSPPQVAREAAWSLGEIGAAARASIVKALSSPPRDDALAIQLLFAAAKLRPVPVAELRPYLAMANRPAVQWAAAYAIARIRAAAGVRDLIALAGNADFVSASIADTRRKEFSSSDVIKAARTADVYALDPPARQRTRAEIARALSKQAAGDSLGDASIAVLLKLAGDSHPHVRINAVRSLATYGSKGRAAVTAATSDADANVRISAAQSLGTVLDSAVTAWAPLWQRDTSWMYRSSLLVSAARTGVTIPDASSWKSHRDWHYRAAALTAATANPDTIAAVQAARAFLTDPDGRVRAAAYGSLAATDTVPLPAGIHSALINGLVDPDFYARATIVSVLTPHANAADVPAVLASYTKSLADSGNDARIAAIGYLAAAWKKDSAKFSPDLTRRLAALAPSDDPLVRAQAESVSVFSAWPSTSGNPRALSWYENLVRTYVVPALQGKTQRATLKTRRGDIVLELFGADAPITVWNFMNLARTGYYRGTGFHRVVPNFVAQDGDPRDDGNGGPGYAIRDEMNRRRYERGALGMALSGPDTGGSQYFITHSPQPHLDGHYTVFGRVIGGYRALDAIVQGDRILSITVQ